MPIYNIKNKKLIELKTKNFSTERELQELIDENLNEIFGLEFIRREFGGQGLSIDTIAYDPQTRAPVLIEYKRDVFQSIVDQGMAYLHWLLTHKGDYLIELQKKLGKKEVDWSQPRVIFIAKRFNIHQIYASGFKNAPFELWRYDLCDNILLLEPIETPKSDVSVTSVLKTKEAKQVIRQIKTYTLDDHLKKASDKTKILFAKLQKMIKSLDERIQENPVSWYIGYKIRWFNFVSISIFRDKIRISIRKAKLEKDKEKKFTKAPLLSKWGEKTPVWWIDISKEEDLDYVFEVIKESYEAAPDR
jgi:predicted transport protein